MEHSEGPGDDIVGDYSGPWFSTQLTLSLGVGLSSFLLFCLLRTRWQLVYMPRTKLKDFSPALAHSPDVREGGGNRFFGWILPTLRTSEFVVLQTVGLDATVLLNFFGMSCLLFAIFAGFSVLEVLGFMALRPAFDPMLPPHPNVTLSATTFFKGNHTKTPEPPSFFDLLNSPSAPNLIYLLFAYLFTGLTLSFLHRNYHRFVTARQAFTLELLHSVSARTVIVTDVPTHLRGDRALAEYFEGCGWTVESVNICRNVGKLRQALDKRTEALLNLERFWAIWVGNPAQAEGYNPDIYQQKDNQAEPLIPGLASNNNGEQVDAETLRQRYSIITTSKSRPTFRPHYFGSKVDAIQYWEDKFVKYDEQVRNLRKTGQFAAGNAAFVTFEDVKDAQCASQVVHYREHSKAVTKLAPEPRDVIWSRMTMSRREVQVRDMMIMGLMTVIMLTLTLPLNATFASFLSNEQIKKFAPWLWRLIKKDDRVRAIVQNTIPSILVATFGSVLPFALEFLSYMQGFKSRSAVEYSLMRKYYLFLLFSVLFIFLVASTWWELAERLAGKPPSEIPGELSRALQAAKVRNFMVSYIMLQGIGMMPVKLLNIGPLFSLAWARLWAKTPRDFAEANAPPIINYGWVYPQALLVFTITMMYSSESPLILIFGSIYFGLAFDLVHKYKLLFIYFKPFESRGDAWGITFRRVVGALLLFQLFTTGLFSLRGSFLQTALMLPLSAYTLWWGYTMSRDCTPLSQFTALSSICDVQRGEGMEQVLGVGLNRLRYAVNDDTLYVAPSDKCTDYSQPPMNAFYNGVLTNGRKRYAHPALSGRLPKPWLPAPARPPAFGDGAAQRRGVVLSLRRKVAKKVHRGDTGDRTSSDATPEGWTTGEDDGQPSPSAAERTAFAEELGFDALEARVRKSNKSSSSLTPSNPWRENTPTPPAQQPSSDSRWKINDNTTGDEHIWDDEDEDGDSTPIQDNEEPPASPSTYFHRPHRRRTLSGAGA